ncbi:MarR family transcriptional regulator [Candidatus Peregrinibacteria bacterium]|nr:MarR family transcriptional regulator [Candidatus Peregrinibacteria bacterium]
MPIDFYEKLKEIGFNEREARIYLELLRIGPQAVSVIAKRIGINRTTTYSILKSLEKKGVVASYRNSNIKYFMANDPNALIGYIDRKCRIFDYQRSQLIAAIPEFRSICGNCSFKKPVVSYFDGREGLKHVMYDALKAKDLFRSYLPLHKWLEAGMEEFLIEFRNLKILNKKIILKTIVPDNKKIHRYFEENYENYMDLTDILYISISDFESIFENGMNIYNDKVSILHLDKGHEYGVVIQSEQIAEMHKVIFDMAWNGFRIKKGEKV